MAGLVFAAPLALAGLLALPVLWWLLRVRPPAPRTQIFPPLMLLARLRSPEETPATTPLWLLVLRLLLVTALVLALSGPQIRPQTRLVTTAGPVWLVVDNGWSAAPDWENRKAAASRVLEEAAEKGSPVALVATAEGANEDIRLQPAGQVQNRLNALEPRGWLPDHAALKDRLIALAATPPKTIVLIAEPVESGGFQSFITDLHKLAPGAAWQVSGTQVTPPLLLTGAKNEGESLSVTLERLDSKSPSAGPAMGKLQALDRRRALLAETAFQFAAGASEAKIDIRLPVDLRNEVARLEIAGARSAASVRLLDDRFRRRKVGLVSGQGQDQSEPFLAATYYLSRAFSPFADVTVSHTAETGAAIDQFTDEGVSVIVMADIGAIQPEVIDRLKAFMRRGGVLIRFAGPHLAAGDDPLVPVPLRRGERALGGALSWGQPQPLAEFPETSPFAGLAVPRDVLVSRQILAEPNADLDSHSWARLTDGTPLVTTAAEGAGRLVLVHVTADTNWSNLPISGLFVEMLQRMTALSLSLEKTDDANTSAVLPLFSQMAGDGRLLSPDGAPHGLALKAAGTAPVSHDLPPGLYGTPDAFRAVSATTPHMGLRLSASTNVSPATSFTLEAQKAATRLAPPLWIFAIAAFIADMLAMALLGHTSPLFGKRRPRQTLAGVGIALMMAMAALAGGGVTEIKAGETIPPKTVQAALNTHLAYIETGVTEIDDNSRLGLAALVNVISSRTSLEPGAAVSVNPEQDDLNVYPLIYWPVDPASPMPSARAMARIDAYMKTGGTVLFDTRDQLTASPGRSSPGNQRLRDMLSQIDVPPLEPAPSNHVLTKSFYLLESFPGRYDGSPLWVAAAGTQTPPRPANGGDSANEQVVSAGDGVSPILITANDLAGAWAADEDGNFLNPLVPGPVMQGDERQREMAFRVGVNIVMYTLTGNYKSDQVHIPFILERLGK